MGGACWGRPSQQVCLKCSQYLELCRGLFDAQRTGKVRHIGAASEGGGKTKEAKSASNTARFEADLSGHRRGPF